MASIALVVEDVCVLQSVWAAGQGRGGRHAPTARPRSGLSWAGFSHVAAAHTRHPGGAGTQAAPGRQRLLLRTQAAGGGGCMVGGAGPGFLLAWELVPLAGVERVGAQRRREGTPCGDRWSNVTTLQQVYTYRIFSSSSDPPRARPPSDLRGHNRGSRPESVHMFVKQ